MVAAKSKYQPKRFDVWLMDLDPTIGAEIQKTRPCVVISPDEMNQALRTVIVAPMTSAVRPYPSRIAVEFKGKKGQVALDQLRTLDKSRLAKHWGVISEEESLKLVSTLAEMFSM